MSDDTVKTEASDVQSAFEKIIERTTGMTISELRRTPLSELREKAEQKRGSPIEYYSAFPLIGRGSVIRQFVTHEECERLLAESIALGESSRAR